MKRQKTRTGRSLGLKERESMIREYLTGQYTKVQLWKKYTGQDNEHGQLLGWMRKLGYISDERRSGCIKSTYLIPQTLPLPHIDDPNVLQLRMKELEKQLENAQLKAEGYELIIEIAEKELKIPTRKKSDTK